MYQASLTTAIIVGVSILVIGQVLLKIFVEPIHQLRVFKGTITDSLNYHAPVYSNPGMSKLDDAKEASSELRKLGSELMAKRSVVPCYRFWSLLRVVPKLSDINRAHNSLIGLSNGLSPGDAHDNRKCVEEIKAALRLPKQLLR